MDAFAPRLSFFFNAHNNLFEEVSKYRAARRIWARIMKDRFGAKNEKSMMLKFHTQTGGSTLTAQQVENNIVRVAIQTLAAVLGGTQSLHTNSKDEALALPTEESVRTALRTQQIVAYESGAADTIDPLAGSFYVESLTSQIEEQAMDLIRRIDDLGGSPSAIDKGFMQQEIMDAAYEYQKQIENGKEIVVGVNKFQVEEPAPKGLLRVDMSVGELQKNKISALKEERDSQKVSETLEALRKACQGDDNLMPYIIDAVKAYATLGEISQVMRDIFGEYKQSVML